MTMSSDEIFAAIEKIANTSGKKDKESLVREHTKDEHFLRVLEYAYNPFKTYGIIKTPDHIAAQGCDGDIFDEETWALLDKLIKRELTGDTAKSAVADELNRLEEGSGALLMRIIRKDLRAGFSESTINKAAKGTIPVFPYMRCSLTSKVDISQFSWGMGVISQEKADGMFANVDHEISGVVDITSRQGSPFPQDELGDFVDEVRDRIPHDMQMHGEFLVMFNDLVLPREKSNGVMNRILKGGKFEPGEKLIYQVWDMIPLGCVKPKGSHDIEYRKRLMNIVVALRGSDGNRISLIPTRMVHTIEEAYSHYAELLAEGKEGTIIKEPTGIWKDGTSKQQVKLKLEVDVDLKVVGILPGREGSKNEGRAGSLTCETSCGALRVDVAVKNEAMRDHVDANPDEWLESIIVVRSNQILTPSKSSDFYSLFLPRMVEAGYRVDKDEADSLQQVQDQFDSAIRGGAKKAA